MKQKENGLPISKSVSLTKMFFTVIKNITLRRPNWYLSEILPLLLYVFGRYELFCVCSVIIY